MVPGNAATILVIVAFLAAGRLVAQAGVILWSGLARGHPRLTGVAAMELP